MVTVSPRTGGQIGGVGACAWLGQAIAREMVHGAELRQKSFASRCAAEGVDHPCRHIVDRYVGSGRRTPLRQLLEDQRGVEPRQGGSADVFLDINAAKTECSGLA